MRFDPAQRRTSITYLTSLTQRCAREQRVYLRVPFAEKQDAKRLGCCWDPAHKLWFVDPTGHEALALWQRAGNPYPILHFIPPSPRRGLSRAIPAGLRMDRFGIVLTDADLSA
jgi:hypothetical protein